MDEQQDNSRLEEAFALIGKGNQFEEEEDFWEATQCFCDAMTALFQLAVELEPTTPQEDKIEELYQSQCREYLHRARRALIAALTAEDAADHDKSNKDADPKFITLTNEEAKKRVQIFSKLYSKELEVGLEDLAIPEVPEAVAEQQSSLEERLRSLNDSLIPSLKTEDERMKDINQGLKGLGVNAFSHADASKQAELDIPVSKEDQIAQIMAQAKDEAIYDAVHGGGGADNDDVILTDDEDTEEEEADIDISVDLVDDIPKLLNKKSIRKYVVNAQMKLAQLVALLDTETSTPAKKVSTSDIKKDEKKDTDEDVDKDDEDDEEKEDDSEDDSDEEDDRATKVEFDLGQARTLLLKANKNLSNAVTKWEVER